MPIAEFTPVRVAVSASRVGQTAVSALGGLTSVNACPPCDNHSRSGGLVVGGQASRGHPGRAPPALPALCVGEASGHRAGTAPGRHPVRG